MKIKTNEVLKDLTIVDESIKKINSKQYVLCKCKCGNIKYILKSTLASERIRDCGCGNYMLKRLVGKKFGMLTVVDCYRKRLGKNNKVNIICKCKCDCGNFRDIPASKLLSGSQTACGCRNKFNFEKYRGKTYGKLQILDLINKNKLLVRCQCECGKIIFSNIRLVTCKKNAKYCCNECFKKLSKKGEIQRDCSDKTRLRRIYRNMIDRCYSTTSKDYKWYGSKGIRVCSEWVTSFENFYVWALHNQYKCNLTLERIDCSKDYCPENCKWATWKEQANNRSNNRLLKIDGNLMTLSQIADKFGINYRTLCSRLKAGLSLENAVSKPIQRKGDL